METGGTVKLGTTNPLDTVLGTDSGCKACVADVALAGSAEELCLSRWPYLLLEQPAPRSWSSGLRVQ